MRGRWAAGIVPRNFSWIIKDRLAVSERPGGYAPHHRRVRRQEEILWLKGNGFDRVISLLASNHNLHAYEELGMAAAHFPLPGQGDGREMLAELYPAMLGWLKDGERLLVHHEELNERLSGVIAGFLCWSGVIPEAPRAVSVVEQLLKRQMGAAGRTIVATVLEIPPAPGSGVRSDELGGTEIVLGGELAEEEVTTEPEGAEAEPAPGDELAPTPPGGPRRSRRAST